MSATSTTGRFIFYVGGASSERSRDGKPAGCPGGWETPAGAGAKGADKPPCVRAGHGLAKAEWCAGRLPVPTDAWHTNASYSACGIGGTVLPWSDWPISKTLAHPIR